jgi:hypothetical protein
MHRCSTFERFSHITRMHRCSNHEKFSYIKRIHDTNMRAFPNLDTKSQPFPQPQVREGGHVGESAHEGVSIGYLVAIIKLWFRTTANILDLETTVSLPIIIAENKLVTILFGPGIHIFQRTPFDHNQWCYGNGISHRVAASLFFFRPPFFFQTSHVALLKCKNERKNIMR